MVRVAEVVGRTLVACGVDHVFGVVGSGNFHVTGAMIDAGARFVAARHEGGAATMADGYARTAGAPAALTVHQGCGLTNALTGIAEAAKSRTPLVVLAPEAVTLTSNFHVDQEALAYAVGAVPLRITDPATAAEETAAAVAMACHERRTVVLNLPLVVLDAEVEETPLPGPSVPPPARAVAQGDLERLTAAVRAARRPVFVAGRGARSGPARDALVALADTSGALLATSAVAKGLFHDQPWSLDVSGGFSSPLAAELIAGADLVVGWGCALNMWTMRHGRLIGPGATVVQVDDTPEALGMHRELSFGVVGDVAATARGVERLLGSHRSEGYRSAELRERLDTGLRWRDVPYTDTSDGERIDPRTLTSALDDLLPRERVVAVDSGNFMGYPAMYLEVPDEQGFCFTQAFQSIGLGLATAIGAALARPDRLPVAALGDGGALMGAAELDTVRRLGLPMVVVVYNDDAYGAEVHHFTGEDHATVTFPPTDIAAVGAGYGFEAVTVRGVQDLAPVRAWLEGPRDRPLLIDAKVVADEPAWWLAEAFGH
ncbi:Acetolactate synthase large subunit [Georgenia satyanarayanai]|uniref:Acetolactate synthase large subunit n=1 Tax=Georgenia satyanarayanai TaxID=860221 RepID=A0A2Y9A221_9MICO|nr:thiamine pyrophosphate-dependent acetolactate synthase large subunit-like protein [Georgenia satyanarayanai]SSA36539.1 Acetolactate synthase large subunit [Georgenia satyanarayanai]